MGKEKCKICNEDFSNLGVHLKRKHGLTTQEYYKRVKEHTLGEVEAPVKEEVPKLQEMEPDVSQVETTTTNKKITESIFKEYKKDPDRPLSEFLKEMTLENEAELRAIVRQYKTGSPLPVHEQMKQRESYADLQAQKLLDKDEVEVTMLPTAEVLQNKYGYEVVDVRSSQGTRPKTWVLKRRT